MFPDPKAVKRVTSIGAGPIGGGWTAYFLSRGFEVIAYIHDEAERHKFETIVRTAWKSLTSLGLQKGASLDRLTVTTDLNCAVQDTDFIQESAPEKIEVKQELYADLGKIVPEGVVIGSSSSGLTMSDIQVNCSTPSRCIISHPFNPPYLLPLVEIVGGKKTCHEAVVWASNFYEAAGKSPLVLKKEIPGFIATRLQEALWREALHMVANGEAMPADIDYALINGPAPRMAVQGQCMAFHVACGEGGMATNLDQFGPALQLPWTRLQAPKLTKELRDRIVEGCNEIAGEVSFETMAAKRDAQIVAVLLALKETR